MGNHEPSKRKLDRARKDGQVAKSSYFSQSFPMLVLLTIFSWQGPKALVDFKILLNYLWIEAFTQPQLALVAASKLMLYWSLLLLASVAAAGVCLEFAQVGFNFDTQQVLPKSKRVDFVAGAKRIFLGMVNPLPLMLRAICMAVVMYFALRPCLLQLPAGLLMSLSNWSNWFSSTFARVFKAMMLGLIANALVDYGLKYRSHRKQLMMTDEEVRREHKDDEGDPLMKHLRRHEHQALISQDVIQRVRKAKVLIVESK